MSPRPFALFDLDGTLTDPTPGIVACHEWALEEGGIEVPDSVDLAELAVLTPDELYARVGVPAAKVEEVATKFRERFTITGWLEDTVYDGIPEALKALREAGWLLGVAGTKLEPITARLLDRVELSEFFDVVSGLERTRTTKREVIEHAMGQVDAPLAGVAVIGDRRRDIEVAKALEMTAIGAGWGFGRLEELMAADAHAIAVTPAELTGILLDE